MSFDEKAMKKGDFRVLTWTGYAVWTWMKRRKRKKWATSFTYETRA
jgi:hypothetical protein